MGGGGQDGREVGEPAFEHGGYDVDVVEVFAVEEVDVVFYISQSH